MPIIPFLDGERFDLEGRTHSRRCIRMICVALRTGDCDETNNCHEAHRACQNRRPQPDILCEEVLKDIRTLQQRSASEAARSSSWDDRSLGIRNTG